MKPNVILDSSVWIEIFREGPLVGKCRKEMDASRIVGVPTVSIYEVYRKILISVSEEISLSVVAFLKQYPALDLSIEVAITAADLSVQHRLGMADSVMLAHAMNNQAKLVTMDNDFAGIHNVVVLRKN